ncbi:N-acetyltransferase [Planococcus sp. CP5-4]|uniref:GNAT family N-acetyltransferase n=1 Tax=unclassified Planococcus (in: firmicutes) TaxID=2662419 RepID=UPI001C227F58|nr:N-acetyltransferase [Planococcus sp. CP5-4]MBU9672634.1 N-acetyltransferase [Planococcus sp. CP5-4_YE]MBV0909684.1 N-acetyltransferase [Planococcus sp. CP5-4_UN]MBW6064414.1 N-acetyltransferase [Planococcus sp. CP5-4]
MEIIIEQERASEFEAVEELIRQAFASEEYSDQTEHQLVKRLRNSKAYVTELSLTAKCSDAKLLGHILLTKAWILEGEKSCETLALAPVSVSPEHQRKGIGSALINASFERAKQLGFSSVIVLGHPAYYPKFGFEPASRWNIRAPFDVPEEAFMVIELVPGALANVSGVVQYAGEFSTLKKRKRRIGLFLFLIYETAFATSGAAAGLPK